MMGRYRAAVNALLCMCAIQWSWVLVLVESGMCMSSGGGIGGGCVVWCGEGGGGGGHNCLIRGGLFLLHGTEPQSQAYEGHEGRTAHTDERLTELCCGHENHISCSSAAAMAAVAATAAAVVVIVNTPSVPFPSCLFK